MRVSARPRRGRGLRSRLAGVRAAIPAASMTQDEHRWLRAAIQADAERAALRKAVIEKSIIGLFWLLLGFIGKVLYEYLVSHGWKG